MKLSVSLPDDDVEFLDRYARERRVDSRSAVVHRAITALRSAELGAAYESAWAEWDESGDGELWERAASDAIES
jgi:Arc/MetJ-type ribon-helix-helix transcriptional regulator